MIELSSESYLWIKALHMISVISWMAGLLYLPRLFVYHTQAAVGSEQSETFKIMERRLLRAIMTPALLASWIFGLVMVAAEGETYWSDGWFMIKGVAVIGLTISHMRMAAWRRDFAEDANTRSEKFFRVANEVPTVLMIIIVIMVIVRPF